MEPQTDQVVHPHQIVDSPDDLVPLSTALSADDFKLAFRGLAAGVAIVTSEHDGELGAMTATSVASISATPPLLIFSASQLSSATAVIAQAETVVVHILTADQLDLAILCAASGADRFADPSPWRRLPTGEPYLPGTAWIRGRVVNRFAAGASIVHVVEALTSNVSEEQHPTSGASPLVYHNRTWHALDERSALALP